MQSDSGCKMTRFRRRGIKAKHYKINEVIVSKGELKATEVSANGAGMWSKRKVNRPEVTVYQQKQIEISNK